MKKIICLVIALAVCLGLAAPVFATNDEHEGFVPSITYKPAPEIIPVTDDDGNPAIGVIRNEEGEVIDYMYDNDGHGCLLITPIAHVWDPEEEVPADVERLLTFVYEELNNGNMELPYEKLGDDVDAENLVIRDLFDARWACEEHRLAVEGKGIQFEITFELGIAAGVPVYVMTYDEETKDWDPIVKTVNNGDGTVTCTFEHLCAITFSVPVVTSEAPVEEPEEPCQWWWLLLLLAVIVIIIILIIIKKHKKEEEAA